MNWIEEEKKYIFQTYKREPLILVRGKGAYVWDAKGKKYLDFFSGLGVNNLGHRSLQAVQAIRTQANKLIHASNLYYTLPQILCARELIHRTFPGKVFFSNSGAEANECALKCVRLWGKRGKGGRTEIISFLNSFHGRTLGTLSLTGQKKYRKGFEPLLSRVRFAKFNDLISVKKLVNSRTSAIFIEPVQGEGGVFPADRNFLKDLRKLCDQKDLLLVFDEVQSGMGRTGNLFSYQDSGVIPDVLTAAKGLGGGLPIGATIARDKVASLFIRGSHASTFGGNPVVCSSAYAVLKATNGALLDSVRKKGRLLFSLLSSLKEKFPGQISEVRGLGLMIGMELKVHGDPVVRFCRENGLLINCTQDKVLRFLPPLMVSHAEIKMAFDVLERAFCDRMKN